MNKIFVWYGPRIVMGENPADAYDNLCEAMGAEVPVAECKFFTASPLIVHRYTSVSWEATDATGYMSEWEDETITETSDENSEEVSFAFAEDWPPFPEE